MTSSVSVSQSVRLPTSAVLERDGRALVFVVDETKGAATETPVKVVDRGEGSVVVTGPLEAGARVVTAGVSSLKAGEPVRIEVGAAR
jgi:multidrug efflux pump subunit AcrA (membrane-fusion protein)